MKDTTTTSYLKNTLVMYKKDDYEKVGADAKGNLWVKLDGYAIIPMDLYNKLNPTKELIEEFSSIMTEIIQMGVLPPDYCSHQP